MKRILSIFFFLSFFGCLLVQETESGKPFQLWLPSQNGKRIYVHIHAPPQKGVFPAIILVPGGLGDGSTFDTRRDWANAESLTKYGIIAVHFDPQGRGKSEGSEDWNGFIHQDDLKAVIEYAASLPYVNRENIGIITFSYGITMGAGALGRYDLPARYLLDVEGPSSRHYTTKNDSPGVVKILAGHTTGNNDFWAQREAIRFIGKLQCRYYRLQAEIDHAQGRQVGHAIEMLNTATRNGVWNQCNRNPPNIIYDANKAEEYEWFSGRLKDHGSEVLHYVLAIVGVKSF